MYASYFLQETKEDSSVLYIYYYFSYTYIFSNTQTLTLMDITLFMNVSSISSLEVSALGMLYCGQVTFTYQFSW